jgi:hypothetical protein
MALHRLIALVALCIVLSPQFSIAQSLPASISDEVFWRLIQDLSESGRPYTSFFISNETTFQSGIPALLERTAPGGVYLGVGAEQNFTYISATRPDIGFVIDIRRENMLEHLLYKAMFALASDRDEFVSRLFSRDSPPGLTQNSSAAELFAAYATMPLQRQFMNPNLQAMKDYLTNVCKFQLTSADLAAMDRIYKALVYGFSQYEKLMTLGDGKGNNWGYLDSEEKFQVVRDMQNKNLIVPVIGDFAGPKAIRSIAAYVQEHDARVMTFYTSNVEISLFQGGEAWRRFYSNVGMLPLAVESTFLRAVSVRMPSGLPRWNLASDSMVDLIQTFNEGSIQSFDQVITHAH